LRANEESQDSGDGSRKEKIAFDDPGAAQLLMGQSGGNLKLVERETGASLHVRGSEVTILGEMDAIGLARTLLEQLYGFAKRGAPLGAEDIVRAARVLRGDRTTSAARHLLRHGAGLGPLAADHAQGPGAEALRRRHPQARHRLRHRPAGTGKTYLAMALAVRALVDKEIKRIILARPAVEAGEKLGFLPGSMEEKVNPYLRPLYDALHDMMDMERAEQLIGKGIIEVAPLAFMRGRTLNDSFVILDEAQNTTSDQMKMFLTRLGFNSRRWSPAT
jgi:phosphate starvation-inducible PhoH-like protein